MCAKESQIKTLGVSQALRRTYTRVAMLSTVNVSRTNFDLVNMLQKKALRAFSAPIFPQNCGKTCGLSGWSFR